MNREQPKDCVVWLCRQRFSAGSSQQLLVLANDMSCAQDHRVLASSNNILQMSHLVLLVLIVREVWCAQTESRLLE